MCHCTCHHEGYEGCGDCKALHTPDELVAGADNMAPEVPAQPPTSRTACPCQCHKDYPYLHHCMKCAPAHGVHTPPPTPDPAAPRQLGSHDDILPNSKGADNNQPYRFGRKPTVAWPYPFNERQFARLLILRARLADTQQETSE